VGGPTCTALDGRAGHGPAGQGRRWPFFCSDHPQSISSRPAGENTVARGVAGAGRWPARHGHGVEPNRSDTRLGGTVGGVSATWGGPMTNPPAVRTRSVRTTSRVVRDAGVRPGMRGKSNLVMVSTINVQESSYSSGPWDAIFTTWLPHAPVVCRSIKRSTVACLATPWPPLHPRCSHRRPHSIHRRPHQRHRRHS